MDVISRVRAWWRLRAHGDAAGWDGDMPAWLSSLILHLGILVGLTLIVAADQREHLTLILLSDAQS